MENLFNSYINMIETNFGCFSNIFSNIKDNRKQYLIKYKKETLFLYILFTFIFKQKTISDLYFKIFNESHALENLKIFSGDNTINRLPFYGTVSYLASKINPEDVFKSLKKIINSLIRKKIFNKFKFLNKYFLVAIDATQQTYTKEYSKEAIKVIHNKGLKNEYYTYHYYILNARIVFPNGFTIPIATEFIENGKQYNNNNAMKQDCEILGAYRILKKIKKYFPQLPICILADSLYINEKIFSTCRENNWKYIITYKEEKAKTIYTEFKTQIKDKLVFKKKIRYSLEKERKFIKQNMIFANAINYHSEVINLVEVDHIETKLDKNNNEKTNDNHFMYVTNIDIKNDNVFEIVNFGGRQRWKIENQGFNEEKNGGYNLNHFYSKNERTRKVYLYFMQLAHLFNNVYELGILTKKNIIKKFKSIKNIAEKIIGEFIYKPYKRSKIKKINFKFETGKNYEFLYP